ncbi:MAG: hypothetical protein WC047_05125, partial [Kiritimatiellales bacterium]
EKNNNALMKAIEFLPPERAILLKMPFLEFNAFMKFAAQVYEKINARDWHDLEGWVESGLVAHEFRLGEDLPWMRAEQLLASPDAERNAIMALIKRPGFTRIRKLSPAEVWERGRARLTRLPDYIAPQIIGEDNGVERRIGKNGLIEFEDRNIGPGTFRYLAQAVKPDGAEEPLAEGEIYLTFCNPFDAGVLYVCKAGSGRGSYIGACKRWDSVSRTDLEALHRQMGAAAKEETKRLLPFQARHTEEMRQRTTDAKWNTAVLAGKPVTVEERAARERIKAAGGDLEDIFGTRNERKEVLEHKEEESETALDKAVNDMDKMF